MKIAVDKSDFQDALKKVSGVTEKKSSLPILTNFLLEAKDDYLYIIGTDLEIFSWYRIPAKIEEEGKICVNAKKITDISKLVSGNEILIYKEENTLKIKSAKTNYKLQTFDPEDFPKMPEFQENNAFYISGVSLLRGISSVMYASSKESSRYALSGVAFSMKGNIIDFVATDGHRLALYRVNTDQNLEKNILIVPQKALNELKKLITGLEDIEISYVDSESMLFFKSKEWLLATRLVEGAFPDYEAVIPESYNIEIVLNIEEFENALKRVSVVIDSDIKPVVIRLEDNKMIIKTPSSEENQAEEQLDIEYNQEPFEIGFNSRYIIDALEPIEEKEFIIRFTSPQAQTLILPKEEQNYKAIVMPMEVK
ncbi:DNA polymerase III subunit beta [Venenivibrio stagnispumantis]|uniref:Beta sliding clamp n=1 Tax=Venenivibrio stagnispumantis TaxID=407998 RepID=A0AA46AEQ1_9AQUI|nr:DNA polymerase III subunit beta [Venenivibrio stagnispumantis]MCW4572803.1 DNA polymerase III subunit beta [Venenivibrio stagnispumantis]SMP13734.1 DNA polymerase-3 subunit beta [Venenivibrio stagnispumantis]